MGPRLALLLLPRSSPQCQEASWKLRLPDDFPPLGVAMQLGARCAARVARAEDSMKMRLYAALEIERRNEPWVRPTPVNTLRLSGSVPLARSYGRRNCNGHGDRGLVPFKL